MKITHRLFAPLPITRILFAGIVGTLAIVISNFSLTLLAQPAQPAADSTSSELGNCPACRPICGGEVVSTFEVWYRMPDAAPPGAHIPLEVQAYAMGEQHDLEALTVTLPAGLEVNARKLPSWLQKSDRSVVWSPGAIEPDDHAGMWFTAGLTDAVAFGETLTPTIALALDGEQCTLPARPLHAQFPARRLAIPLLNENDSSIVVQNLEQPATRPLMFAWDAGATAPSHLLTSFEIEQGHTSPLFGSSAEAGIVYAVDSDKFTEATEAAQTALGYATAWQAWEDRWQAGEFGWGSSLSALLVFTGTDAAAYVALDAPLTSPPDRPFTYTLPLIDLAASSKVTVAVQNIGQETTTGAWHAWPMTDTTSSSSGTFTLPPGAATHIELDAQVADDFQGAVQVNAGSPLAVVALSQASNTQSAYTAQPVGEPMAPDATLRGLTLKQSDWETGLWIHNTSSSQTAQATAVFQDFGGQAVYTATEAIPARGTWRLDVSSLPLPADWTGWVEIQGSSALHATTRLTHTETNQRADVGAFLWPPAGAQPAPRTWGLPTVSSDGSLFIANPDDSGPLMTTPMWFGQFSLWDFTCNILQGAQSSHYPTTLPFNPDIPFGGSMIIQARADLSAERGLTPLSVYLDPDGQALAPTGLPYLPRWAAYPELRCGLAGLMAPRWDIPMDQTRTFDLRLEDVADATRLDVEVTFDPAILAIDDADPDTPGVQIQPGPALDHTWVVSRNIATDGTLTYTLGSREGGRPIHEAGSIGSIAFRGQQPGESLVTTTVKAISIAIPSAWSVKPPTVTQRIHVSVPTATPTPTATSTPTPTSTPTSTPTPTPTEEPTRELYLPLISKN